MEEIVKSLVELLGNDDDDIVEDAKRQLLSLGEKNSAKSVYNYLESLKRQQKVPVQWEIDEILELLIPNDAAIVEEDIDDPTKRELRQSEIELVAKTPDGILLYKSKVDTRWMVMRVDPYSGQFMGAQEFEEKRGNEIYRQLTGREFTGL